MADADLEGIREITEERWGSAQAVRYLSKLAEKANALLEYPYLGTVFEGRTLRLRSYKSGQHRILYEVSDDAITIVRVFHVKMDPHRHLRRS